MPCEPASSTKAPAAIMSTLRITARFFTQIRLTGECRRDGVRVGKGVARRGITDRVWNRMPDERRLDLHHRVVLLDTDQQLALVEHRQGHQSPRDPGSASRPLHPDPHRLRAIDHTWLFIGKPADRCANKDLRDTDEETLAARLPAAPSHLVGDVGDEHLGIHSPRARLRPGRGALVGLPVAVVVRAVADLGRSGEIAASVSSQSLSSSTKPGVKRTRRTSPSRDLEAVAVAVVEHRRNIDHAIIDGAVAIVVPSVADLVSVEFRPRSRRRSRRSKRARRRPARPATPSRSRRRSGRGHTVFVVVVVARTVGVSRRTTRLILRRPAL